jgi:hypothetical protein
MQVPILQGRDVNSQDTVDKQSVVIVDESLAQCYFPNQSPLGKGITLHDWEGNRDCTIIGVVPHLRYKSPGQAENTFQAYFPYRRDGRIRYLKHGKELVSLVKRECEQRHENSNSLPQTSLPPVVSGTSCNRVLVRLLFIE